MSFDFEYGRYAVYIWGAFGFTTLITGWMIASSLLSARKWRSKAERGE